MPAIQAQHRPVERKVPLCQTLQRSNQQLLPRLGNLELDKMPQLNRRL